MGANTGLYSLIACAANPSSRVIAWEPVPYLANKFAANLGLNNFNGQCELRRNALSDVGGRATLYVPVDTTMASLNPAHGNHATSPIDVVVETADEAVPADFPVDLIKLDVESYEYQVLCGMQKLLARHRPALIFECLPTTPAEPIEKLLQGLRYRLYQLTASGPVLTSRIAQDDKSETAHNYLATQ
jgi:FkbM family methyltransferase